jgi:DNA-binding transcriptional regulator YhcF (GntR family)
MSYKAMDAVFDADIEDGLAKYVLLAIAKHADEQGECYPSMERLARLTGLSQRTVLRKIGWLEKAGYVSIKRRTVAGKKTSNLYSVRLAYGVATERRIKISDNTSLYSISFK